MRDPARRKNIQNQKPQNIVTSLRQSELAHAALYKKLQAEFGERYLL